MFTSEQGEVSVKQHQQKTGGERGLSADEYVTQRWSCKETALQESCAYSHIPRDMVKKQQLPSSGRST